MKPETRSYLLAADEAISDARMNLSMSLTKQAGRLAYQGRFHAAQALILERTDRIAKTHKGVQIEFSRLSRMEVGLLPSLAPELSIAYRFKALADYEVDLTASVTQAEATATLAEAEAFVAAVRKALET